MSDSLSRLLRRFVLPMALLAPGAQADPSEVNAHRLSVKTEYAANVFTLDDAVVFHLGDPATQTYGWRVRDWQGNLCAEGVLRAGERSFEVEELAPGYFELELKGEAEARWQTPVPFARVLAPESRVYNPDSPFAVDSAQSWLASKGHRGNRLDPENPVEVISDLTRLAGLTMIRDRMNWSENTNPASGDYRWEPFDANATALARRGVQVYSLYESFKNRPAPSWTEGGIRDLAAIHAFSEAAGRNFAGRIGVWEFWNEPDLKRDIPVWDFAAAQKAGWLGFRRGAPDARVLNGSLSNIHRFAGVLDGLLENGIGDYHDIFNLHTYLDPKHHARVTEATFATLARHGQAGKPLWVTEVGLAYEGNGEVAPLQADFPMREHGPDQARAQAERVVTAEVTLHALGADRVFFFVLPPFNEAEGKKVWGLLRWDWLVKPGYVALANLTAQLGDARLLGSYDAGEGVAAWLFEQLGGAPREDRRDTQTLVLWSGVSQTVRLGFDGAQGELELVDLVGSPSALKPRATGRAAGQYAFKVGPAPVYVNGLRGLRPAAPRQVRAAAPSAPAPTREELSTVLRVRLGPQFTDIGQLHAAFPAEDVVEATVDVFNFGDTETRGVLKNLGEGYALLGGETEIAVPAQGRVAVPVRLRLEPGRRSAVSATVLRLGADFSGRTVAPVAIPLLPDFDATLARVKSRPVAEAAKPESWLKNSAGALEIARGGEAGAVEFRATFPANADRWVHPYLKVGEGALAGAMGFSFEIKARAGAAPARGVLVMSDAQAPVDMVYGEQPDIPFELTDQWRTVKVDFRANPMWLRPGQIRLLRIGCNPKEADFGYTIRNMRIHLNDTK